MASALGIFQHLNRCLDHVLPHGHVLPEVERLEDHCEPGSPALELAGVAGFQAAIAIGGEFEQLAIEPQRAGVRLLQQVDAAQEGAFYLFYYIKRSSTN